MGGWWGGGIGGLTKSGGRKVVGCGGWREEHGLSRRSGPSEGGRKYWMWIPPTPFFFLSIFKNKRGEEWWQPNIHKSSGVREQSEVSRYQQTGERCQAWEEQDGGRSSILGGNYRGKKVLTQLQPRIRERRWARQKRPNQLLSVGEEWQPQVTTENQEEKAKETKRAGCVHVKQRMITQNSQDFDSESETL